MTTWSGTNKSGAPSYSGTSKSAAPSWGATGKSYAGVKLLIGGTFALDIGGYYLKIDAVTTVPTQWSATSKS